MEAVVNPAAMLPGGHVASRLLDLAGGGGESGQALILNVNRLPGLGRWIQSHGDLIAVGSHRSPTGSTTASASGFEVFVTVAFRDVVERDGVWLGIADGDGRLTP